MKSNWVRGSEFLIAILVCLSDAHGQATQNPSPMVEHTRAHPRLERTEPEGRRIQLERGTLLITRLHLKRTALLKWGPLGTQQLSEVSAGKSLLKGYAGNSAPDHVDQLHSLGEYLQWIEWGRE